MWTQGCDVIHCGFWINWSHGAIAGSTLTLPSEWALIISAFLALFVKLVGGYLWETICFAIHQTRASLESQDDIHHQTQIILRNTESELAVTWRLIKVGLAHKGARLQVARRSFPLVFLALVYGLSISAAGGLSSRFIAGSDQVQTLSSTCGWMSEPDTNNLTADTWGAANALIVMGRYRYRKSASYAQSCYGKSSSNSTACGGFLRTSLPYTSDTNAPCPFHDEICNGPAITLDTGFLRSDEHLGINTRPEDSISFRKTLTCAPLAGENYTDGWMPPANYTKGIISPWKGYKFGKAFYYPSPENYTFTVAKIWLEIGDQLYNLNWKTDFLNYTGDQSDRFDPIPELQSSDSDTAVISLANRVMYHTPVEDAWFNAENCIQYYNNATGHNETAGCLATNTLSFLGCRERYQFCTAGNKNCSPLTGLYGTTAGPVAPQDLTPTQTAVFKLYWKIAWTTQLNFQLGFVGRESLVANSYLWDGGFGTGNSAELPKAHWQREVLNWMNTTLSVAQLSALTYARAPEFDVGPGLSALKYVVRPVGEQERLLCHKMKMRSAVHTSFSVLGLFTLLGFGLLLLVSSLVIPTLVAGFQCRTGKGLFKRLEWIESSSFQLQRMAAEGRGIGPWEGRDQEVPRLRSGKGFGLTEGSLRGPWEGSGGYGVVRQEEASGMDTPDESVDWSGKNYVRASTKEKDAAALGDE